MRVAIMQPYFLPYIGYFQLISAVDRFVVYDNIKYTKKGWINRNRMLLNGADVMFSVPLKAASDQARVIERELASDFNRSKLLAQLRGAYARAPQFDAAFPLISEIVQFSDENLFAYIRHSILKICAYLDIETPILTSSNVPIDRGLVGEQKVLAICQAQGADTYVNSIGGMELYAEAAFAARGIALRFIRPRPLEYAQFANAFVPWLSIVDVMMFNSADEIRRNVLPSYEIISPPALTPDQV